MIFGWLSRSDGTDPTVELFRLCNSQNISTGVVGSSKIDDRTKTGWSVTWSIGREQLQQQNQFASIYSQVYNILKHQPELVHSIDGKTGRNLLHCVCSNPVLVNHLQLIQLLINTSEYIVDHRRCGSSSDGSHNDSDGNDNGSGNCNNSLDLDDICRSNEDGFSMSSSPSITTATTRTTSTTTATGTVLNTSFSFTKMMTSPLSLLTQQQHENSMSTQRPNMHVSSWLLGQTVAESAAETTKILLIQDAIPSQAQVLRDQTFCYGENCLHLLCTNLPAVDCTTIKYIMQRYPASVCCYDYKDHNLPIHTACVSAYQHYTTSSSTMTSNCNSSSNMIAKTRESLVDILALLLFQYPDACQKQNKDGNLPLHLAISGTCFTNNNASCLTATAIDDHMKKNIPNTVIQMDRLDDTSNTSDERNDLDPYLAEFATPAQSISQASNGHNDKYIDKDDCIPEQITIKDQVSPERKQSQLVFLPEKSSPISVREHGNHDYGSDSGDAVGQDDYFDSHGLIEMIEYLIEVYPAALFVRNNRGYTPGELALIAYENDMNRPFQKLLVLRVLRKKFLLAENDTNYFNQGFVTSINRNNSKRTAIESEEELAMDFIPSHTIRTRENVYQESFLSDNWTSMTGSTHHWTKRITGNFRDHDGATQHSIISDTMLNANDFNADTLHKGLAAWQKRNCFDDSLDLVDITSFHSSDSSHYHRHHTSCLKPCNVQQSCSSSLDKDDDSDLDDDDDGILIL